MDLNINLRIPLGYLDERFNERGQIEDGFEGTGSFNQEDIFQTKISPFFGISYAPKRQS